MSTPAPDVSVIVPFYNEARYLERCVDALLAQTLPRDRYEVILVDNNSTDGSYGLARSRGVTVLTEPKQSSYAARNRGVAHARGRILAFTDSDCEPDSRWLERLLARFASPEVALVIGERRFATESRTLDLLRLFESESASHLTYGYTNNLAIRREVFDAVGPFEEIGRGADTNLFLRTRDRFPEGVRFAPEVSVRHLEIGDVGHHLAKKYTYGVAARKARAAAGLEPGGPLIMRVGAAARHCGVRVPAMAWRIARGHEMPPRDLAWLVALGWASYAAFALGRVAAELRR